MIQITKTKESKLFNIDVISPANGKTLSSSSHRRKVSVFTNINALAKELGAKVGTKLNIIDMSNGESKVVIHKIT